MRMHEYVVPALRSALESVSLQRQDAALLAAVSGGADSVALLGGLALLRAEMKFRLYAVHVEHGLRGENSCADAEFVRALCQRLAVPLTLRHAGLSGGMDSPGAEERARHARQRFFVQAMEELHADALLTAHHLNDQAETVLMRLLRGAGARGLSGMRDAVPFAGGVLLRPFLHLPCETLRQALRGIRQPWREDESNAKPCCLRNQLRLEIFPQLSALQPRAAEHMAQTAERMQCDEDFLRSLAEALLHSAECSWPGQCALDQKVISGAPKPVALRALRLWVEQGMRLNGRDGESGESTLSYDDSLRLYAVFARDGKGSMNLPLGLRVLRGQTFVHLLRQDGNPLLPEATLAPETIRAERQDYRMGAFRFALVPCDAGEPLPDGKQAVFLTDTLLHEGLTLRTPKAGDRIHPFGAPGGKALRRYLTDRKADAPLRSAWPILTRGSEVLWVVNAGASEAMRIREGNGERLWKLSAEEG